jgi:hypothetical protein
VHPEIPPISPAWSYFGNLDILEKDIGNIRLLENDLTTDFVIEREVTIGIAPTHFIPSTFRRAINRL